MDRRRKSMNEVQEDTNKAEAINLVNGIDNEDHSADEERKNQVVTEHNNNTARNQDNVRTRNNLGSKKDTIPCAACRHGRQGCKTECITAPYFPSKEMEEYKSVLKIFGLANIKKILNGLETNEDRLKATESLKWEAKCWSQDDRTGPYDEYKKVLNEYAKLQAYSESHEFSMSQNNVDYRTNLGVDVHNNNNVNVLYESNGGEGCYASVNTGFGGARGGGSQNLINNRQQQFGQYSNFQSLYAGGGNGGSHTLMNNFDGLLNRESWYNNATPIMRPQQETDVGHTLMNDFGDGQLNSQNWSHNMANPIMPRQETDVHRNLQCQNFYHPYQSTSVGIQASGCGYDGSGALMTPTMQSQHHGNEETDELLITELSNATQSSQYPNSHPQ